MAHGDCERRSWSPARAERESRGSDETERESPGSGETERELSDGDGGWGRTTVGVEEAHAQHGFGSSGSGSGSSGLSGLAVRLWSVVTRLTGPSLLGKGLSLSLSSLDSLGGNSGKCLQSESKKLKNEEEPKRNGSRPHGSSGHGGSPGQESGLRRVKKRV